MRRQVSEASNLVYMTLAVSLYHDRGLASRHEQGRDCQLILSRAAERYRNVFRNVIPQQHVIEPPCLDTVLRLPASADKLSIRSASRNAPASRYLQRSLSSLNLTAIRMK